MENENSNKQESANSIKPDVMGSKIYDFRNYECLQCGEQMGHEGKFCTDTCAEEYHYINRTCQDCGGEFWDGGTSCTCEEWE